MDKSCDQADSWLRKDTLADLKDLALELASRPGETRRELACLHIVHKSGNLTSNHCFDQPMAALTIQGRKLIQAGPYEFMLSEGSLLVTCVDMPSISSVLGVSEAHPYLGFYISLDRKILTDLLLELPVDNLEFGHFASAWIERASLDCLDAFRRLARLAFSPERAPILAPMILRELHYFLLLSPKSGQLRKLYMNGGSDKRIADVIGWLRQNVAAPASMDKLAKMANMSVSSFHRHFKLITGSSPLQYHKKLRLYEAQRLMLAENQRATEAALAVGYESITQFNREYRRMFGEPPGRDIANRKRRLGG